MSEPMRALTRICAERETLETNIALQSWCDAMVEHLARANEAALAYENGETISDTALARWGQAMVSIGATAVAALESWWRRVVFFDDETLLRLAAARGLIEDRVSDDRRATMVARWALELQEKNLLQQTQIEDLERRVRAGQTAAKRCHELRTQLRRHQAALDRLRLENAKLDLAHTTERVGRKTLQSKVREAAKVLEPLAKRYATLEESNQHARKACAILGYPWNPD